ncbi:MAG: alanine:cation symporter family protein [Crocinitomicaceae bacterium]|jgi:AGCS family alanine or glycine:cation symporter|nr:alanine:cation symporter family protein [Crocinitomicaceae bacterium]
MKKLFLVVLTFIAPILLFAQEAIEEIGIDQKIDAKFGEYTSWFVELIFAEIPLGGGLSIPWVLIVLVGAAVYFTIYFKLINFTGFFTAIGVVRGKYDDLEEFGTPEAAVESAHAVDGDLVDTIRVEKSDVEGEGEVSHFQALTAALSATVGLGNIAGVAVAISIGGPGATFWMIIAGIIGMATKFVECTLGVKFREVDENGVIYGGPMYYLKKGLAERKMKWLGRILAILFAVMCIGGSFGGGNMFQANQAFVQVESFSQSEITQYDELTDVIDKRVIITGLASPYTVNSIDNGNVILSSENSGAEKIMSIEEFKSEAKVSPLSGMGWIFGIIMAILVGVVIIGGIKKIANVTDKIVPFMVVIYVGAALVILGINYAEIPKAFSQIFAGAFGWEGVAGGVIGVLIQGFRRAAFSNEAGVGSASIAHAAVKTKNPASEGLVALLEPFIDTVLVCTMTALVLVISNIHIEAETGQKLFEYGTKVTQGVEVTSLAFASSISWFPWILTGAVVLFAFSTMISWSYYGYQAWTFLFGRKKWAEYIYKGMFCCFVIIGSAASLGSVIDFSDAMIFAMLVPNIIGLVILTPVVSKELKTYKAKIKAMKSKK